MNPIIRLKLAREEVYVFMQLAQIPGMMGVEPFEPKPEGEALFDLALRTLIARGMIKLDEAGLIVDESVLGIIVASATPDVIAIVNSSSLTHDITTTFPVQLKPGLLISHESNQGIHTFDLYEDTREIANQAVLSLRLGDEIPAYDIPMIKIRETTLDTARSVYMQGESAVIEALRHDVTHPHCLQILAKTLANSTMNASFTLMRSVTDEVDGFVVVASKDAIFTVTPDRDPDSDLIWIESTSTMELRRRVFGACLTVL
ncbi:MAG: hypothetical protein ACK5XN_33645 [Bacteroidota bacterium]